MATLFLFRTDRISFLFCQLKSINIDFAKAPGQSHLNSSDRQGLVDRTSGTGETGRTVGTNRTNRADRTNRISKTRTSKTCKADWIHLTKNPIGPIGPISPIGLIFHPLIVRRIQNAIALVSLKVLPRWMAAFLDWQM